MPVRLTRPCPCRSSCAGPSSPPGLYAVGVVAGCPSGISAAGLSPLGLLLLVALSFMYVIRHVEDVAPPCSNFAQTFLGNSRAQARTRRGFFEPGVLPPRITVESKTKSQFLVTPSK